MKLGLISDVHGNAPALRAVLPELVERTDAILFAGDLFGYYPFVEECADMLGDAHVIAVRGNHDQTFLDVVASGGRVPPEYARKYGTAMERAIGKLRASTREMVAAWNPTQHLEIGGKRILLAHGSPWDPLNGRVYPDFARWDDFAPVDADVIILGHTHYAFSRALGRQQVVNPGSVGQARDVSGRASYAVLDLDDMTVELQRAPYDVSLLVKDAQVHDPSNAYLREVLVR